MNQTFSIICTHVVFCIISQLYLDSFKVATL